MAYNCDQFVHINMEALELWNDRAVNRQDGWILEER